jgi:hypothetical protein
MLFLLVSIIGACSASAAAQSGPVTAAPTPPTSYQTPHDSREQVPLVGGSKYALSMPVQVAILPAPATGKIAMLTPPTNHLCYAMRSYNYVQDGASPDAIKLKDSATCEPAASGRMKSATAHR